MENKQTNQQIIDRYKIDVSSAYPSIYTKEDVSKLLDGLMNELNESNETRFDWDNFNDQVYDIVYNTIDDNYGDCLEVNSDKCELSIGLNNRIEVDDVAYDFDSSELASRVSTKIEKYIKTLKTSQTQTQNNE